MIEIWKFYHRYYLMRWSFSVANVFFSGVLFFGKSHKKMVISDVFWAEVSQWSLNVLLFVISVLEPPNCSLFNAEIHRSVACSSTKWQKHLSDLVSKYPKFVPSPQAQFWKTKNLSYSGFLSVHLALPSLKFSFLINAIGPRKRTTRLI